jgi:Arc/MetJ-type ribon-helix-helix transcriptional regulator
MTAEPLEAGEPDNLLQELIRCVHALDSHEPAELAGLLADPGLGDEARRAVEAVAALQMVHSPQLASDLFPLLASRPQVRYSAAARKVSVSMPEDLTAAVQQRVGRGKFSQYVTEAVSRQLEMDMLAELSELLSAEHGPVPEDYLAEARAAWPDE